jgi:hypothetical protein
MLLGKCRMESSISGSVAVSAGAGEDETWSYPRFILSRNRLISQIGAKCMIQIIK